MNPAEQAGLASALLFEMFPVGLEVVLRMVQNRCKTRPQCFRCLCDQALSTKDVQRSIYPLCISQICWMCFQIFTVRVCRSRAQMQETQRQQKKSFFYFDQKSCFSRITRHKQNKQTNKQTKKENDNMSSNRRSNGKVEQYGHGLRRHGCELSGPWRVEKGIAYKEIHFQSKIGKQRWY